MTKICDYSPNLSTPEHDLIDKIIPENNKTAFRLRRLVMWLISRGARFPKCQIRHLGEECRATFTQEQINVDEEIMYIPQEFIITSEISLKSPICQEIKQSGVDIRSKHTYLASYLLQERDAGKNSWWFPYIDILPKQFNNIPLFFHQDQLQRLKGSISLQKIRDRHDSLRAEYENLCKYVRSYQNWSYDDFVWARLVVITRIFGLLIDGVKTDGLVPMADMINHRRPRETRWTFNQSKKGFIISALQNFEPGQQIFDSYGRKCNSRFFVNYGFSLENNPDNECLIRIKFETDQRTKSFIDFQTPISIDDKKARDMLSLLRWTIERKKYSHVISSYTETKQRPSSGDYIPPISIDNELIVLQLIEQATEFALNQFDHTLQEDNALLLNTTLYPHFSNIRNIILMRRGEKEVLHHWLSLSKKGIYVLNCIKQQIDYSMIHGSNNINTDQYLEEITSTLRWNMNIMH